VWIYVDECTDAGDDVRSAAIRVTLSLDGENFPPSQSTDFVISQRKLFPVTYNGHTYHIEYHEEYLHNYDAEDEYGQTEYEGLPWGLNGVQLSNTHRSFTINETNGDWTSWLTNNPTLLTYDFYTEKHDNFAVTNGAKRVLSNAGQTFTSEIYTKSNGGVKVLTMADQPSGAVEYCYNRNKRDANGSVSAVEWYLPSTDEMEAIAEAGYSRFEEFQEKFYWTSQPAYIRNTFYYEYHDGNKSSRAEDTYAFVVYEDNPNYARATKVIYENSQYYYAESGLNKTPKETHAMDEDCIGKNAKVFEDSYFYKMYTWYRYTEWSWSSFRNETKIDTPTKTADEHFDERRDGKATNVRYHIHLGHLYDDGMLQPGYLHRSENARVRCVRKK
jgi:hypothetical protein